MSPLAAPPPVELLRVADLHAFYGESHILHGMDFRVNRGELVTLLGRNGSGRTTTLALDPELLLLDEPTQGMGHEDVGRVVELIRRVAADRTVLMVEHNLSVVQDLADRVTVLARGSVLAEGTYDEVSRDPAVLEAYIGVPQ